MAECSTKGKNRSLTLAKLERERRWVARDERKCPIDPHTGRNAKSNDPKTWGARGEAEYADAERGGAGVGVMLGALDTMPDHHLVGIDADGAIDADGTVAPWAQDVLDRFPGYAERSPSGEGLHVLGLCLASDIAELQRAGLLTPKGGAEFSRGDHVEIAFYAGGRYFTVTDDRVSDDAPIRTFDRTALDWLLAEHGPAFRSLSNTSESADQSGSGAAFRFLLDQARHGKDEEAARLAIEADDGDAGEWWVRTDDRQRDRAIKNAFASVREERQALANSFPDLSHLEDEPKSKKAEPPASRLRFLSPTDCANAPSRGYVWKGFLAPGQVGCLFGAPGAGKSVLAPFLAYRIARGEPCFGARTKQGGVLYVAAEDPTGMRDRITALHRRFGDAEELSLVEGVSNLLVADAPDLNALLQAVRERKPKLVIIDTLAGAFPGLEENSSEAMGRVVAVANALARHGAAVLLVHHDTKAEGGTPRGHSVLNGALDMAVQVTRGVDGIIRGKLTKNRNGTCDRDIAFRIEVERLGTDEDGDPITAPVADELDARSAPTKHVKLTDRERAVLGIVRDMTGRVPDMSAGVPLSRWKEECARVGLFATIENLNTRKKGIKRAVEKLTKHGLVRVEDDRAFLAPAERHTQRRPMNGHADFSGFEPCELPDDAASSVRAEFPPDVRELV